MVDTVKILAGISNEIYSKILVESDIKKAFNCSTGELYYEIVSASLEGSYSSSLSVRVCDGNQFNIFGKVIIIEGSYHKIVRGQNSFDGFWNVTEVCVGLIKLVENAYKVKLPDIRHWFLQRIDITNCYDLGDNEKVARYINNLSKCQYPRRKLRFYDNESIYLSGRATTIKIYNKLLEFRKNDFNKMKLLNSFNFIEYMEKIKGYVRFECEIKKKKLMDFYKKKFIRINNVNYKELESIWESDFMKLLKLCNADLKVVRNKDSVENRLFFFFGKIRGRNLYNFYLSVMVDGVKATKARMCDSVYYKNLHDLRYSGVELAQSNFHVITEENEVIDFNPFSYEKVV